MVLWRDTALATAGRGSGTVAEPAPGEPALAQEIQAAIRFDGFSLLDIWGVCPGRYTRRNKLTPKEIEADMVQLPELS